ncbi:thiamine diphosphokinase [Oceanicella actignis]|uniref:thiamine diphosphokinase n=1 Tax=Oceanicella actignis TaxID=1189325 RepID=UPI001251FC03|nr:thiamine diphosphokinase [Oceanicella actignis]TYO91501.1 thiamine pyrophosphokinase [Oceanicella actignis]
MTRILEFDAPVALIGGGAAGPAELEAALARAPRVVAADGGANLLAAGARKPDAVIGDMDSVADPARWRDDPEVRFVPVDEQDSTDLEKCLRLTRAPLYLGAGFLGGRMDHSLAALHALLRHADRRVVLLGAHDVAFAAPPLWRARLAPGARVSIFPLAPCRAHGSRGLRWPLDPLALAAGSVIGTSNEAAAEEVTLRFDGPGAVILLEPRFLDAAIESLTGAPLSTRAG